MDWQVILTTVVTSLLSSSVIAAGIIYVVKKSFDRAIDYRFEKLLEESRLHVQELTRRRATIYDKQMDVLQEILSLTYRLRNATRYFSQQLESNTSESDNQVHEAARKFTAYQSALSELLYDERAFLPPHLFSLVHSLNKKAGLLRVRVEALLKKRRSGSKDEWQELYTVASHSFQDIDDLYETLVSTIQEEIGLVAKK